MSEEWRVIAEHPDYAVSSLGAVRREARGQGTSAGRPLRASLSPGGYLSVSLYGPFGAKKCLVHRIVAQAFHDNPESKPLVRHLNDVRVDNRAENLAWGTHSENVSDAARNGKASRRWSTGACWRGHDLTKSENFRIDSAGYKVCKPCQTANKAARIADGLRPDDPRHGTRNAYKEWGCRCDLCKQANTKYNRESYEKARERGTR